MKAKYCWRFYRVYACGTVSRVQNILLGISVSFRLLKKYWPTCRLHHFFLPDNFALSWIQIMSYGLERRFSIGHMRCVVSILVGRQAANLYSCRYLKLVWWGHWHHCLLSCAFQKYKMIKSEKVNVWYVKLWKMTTENGSLDFEGQFIMLFQWVSGYRYIYFDIFSYSSFIMKH